VKLAREIDPKVEIGRSDLSYKNDIINYIYSADCQTKWTEEQINKIINYKHDDGSLINVFDLNFIVCMGNPKSDTFLSQSEGKFVHGNRVWDVSRYMKFTNQYCSLRIGDFDDCSTEEEVRDTATETIIKNIKGVI